MVSSTRAGASRRASARPTTRASAAKHLLSANAARAPQREGDVLSAEPGRSVLGQGTKRKKRDFDSDEGGEGTNICVIVRCRGCNKREVRENSAIAVNTDGVQGKQVELRMRADILNNEDIRLRPRLLAGTGTTSSSPRLSSISSVQDKNHLGLKLREVDPNVLMNLATSTT
ncbi:hypothetical protein AK830_g9713 [Neonectria ditissima]|uniref:Uncharacterized protein n=1 Tax=Neonectria ditissima TaxID=78410 RepID=A0A0N8H5Q8_9HYPO|nr:hypothetical protein AK830_g9713 [Neonectria ditissima]